MRRTDVLDPATWLRGALDLFTPGADRQTSAGRTRPADPLRERDARAAIDKTAGPQWEVAVRFAVAAEPDPRQRSGTPTGRGAGLRRRAAQPRTTNLADAIAAAFGVYSSRNRLHRGRLNAPAATLSARAMRHGFVLSTPELSAIAGLPQDLAVAGLDRARAGSCPRRSPSPPAGAARKSSAAPRSAATRWRCPCATPANTCTCSAPPAPANRP